MTDRPALYPEWASDPGADVTEPPDSGGGGTTKADGWVPGNPELDFDNWQKLFTYLWLWWIDQTAHKTNDLHPNHALPGGVAPSLGAGLGIVANEFSAHVYADGYNVGPGLSSSKLVTGPSANYTYTANRDTYWDLSRAGVWTPVPVGNGAGEPAVTANSTRVYMVVTNGTDRTTLVDRRAARVRLSTHDAVANARYALPATLDNLGGSTDADRRVAKRTTRLDATSGATYELIEEVEGNNSIVLFRRYARINGARVDEVWVSGARCTATSGTVAWIAEASVAYRMVLGSTGDFAEKSGLTAGVTTFNDSEWSAPTVANLIRARRVKTHGDRYGVDSAFGVTGANANLVAHREDVRGGALYTLVQSDVTNPASDGGLREYLSSSSGVTGGTVRALVFNATFNAATGDWDRDVAADAYMLVVGEFGISIYVHQVADGASWDDAPTSGDWEGIARFESTGSAIQLTIDRIQGSGAGAVTIPDVISDSTETDELLSTGPIRLTGVVSDTLVGDVNNYNPTNLATANVLRIDPGGANRAITGIVAQPDGTLLRIFNTADAAESLTLSAEDAASSAANRFTQTPANFVINQGEGVSIWYDGTSDRWRVLTLAT